MSEIGDLQDELERCREAAEWADDMRKDYKGQLDDALGQNAALRKWIKALEANTSKSVLRRLDAQLEEA